MAFLAASRNCSTMRGISWVANARGDGKSANPSGVLAMKGFSIALLLGESGCAPSGWWPARCIATTSSLPILSKHKRQSWTLIRPNCLIFANQKNIQLPVVVVFSCQLMNWQQIKLTEMGGSANMPNLAEDVGAFGMHSIHHFSPCFYMLIGEDPRRMHEPTTPNPPNH